MVAYFLPVQLCTFWRCIAGLSPVSSNLDYKRYAKIVLALSYLGGIVFTVLNAILYGKVRRLLRLSETY